MSRGKFFARTLWGGPTPKNKLTNKWYYYNIP